MNKGDQVAKVFAQLSKQHPSILRLGSIGHLWRRLPCKVRRPQTHPCSVAQPGRQVAGQHPPTAKGADMGTGESQESSFKARLAG